MVDYYIGDYDRINEMARTVRLYNDNSPLVAADPVERSEIIAGVDTSDRREGGQAYFLYLKRHNRTFGVKMFKNDTTSPADRVRRAKCIRSALEVLSRMEYRSTRTLLLFNLLNVPMQYVNDPDGGLAGLIVPILPDSCHIEVERMGRRSSRDVLIGNIVSDRHLIPSRTGSANDPLPPNAKWSFLSSLCEAISFLHELGLIHADISSNNVFVRWAESDDPKAYVIDAFNGFSTAGGNRELKGMRSDVFCPQSFRLGEYTPATDVYCLAWWIVHIAVTADPIGAKLPRPSMRDAAEEADVLYLRHRYVVEGLDLGRKNLSKDLLSVLKEALQEPPASRPSSRELAHVVTEHWLTCRGA